MYIVDNRERALIGLLSSPEVKTLPIGDIWIGVSGEEIQKGGIIAERKTIRDLEASILDGRYKEQRQRLLAHCSATGAQPLYILEGSYFTTTGRLAPKALMKIVARLQYKHKIPVIHVNSTAETSQLVEALHEYFMDDPTNFQAEDGVMRAVDGIHVQKKTNASDPKHFATASLAQCPGISVKMADTIVSHFSSWDAIMKATQDDIQGIVQANGRKIGPAAAKKVYDLLHATW